MQGLERSFVFEPFCRWSYRQVFAVKPLLVMGNNMSRYFYQLGWELLKHMGHQRHCYRLHPSPLLLVCPPLLEGHIDRLASPYFEKLSLKYDAKGHIRAIYTRQNRSRLT